MPRRSPFTTLCGRLARLGGPRRADLHVHTTASDGEFTPTQVVALARQANLAAVAVTDHDTLAAIPEAREAAGGRIEVVAGVEITAGFAGREVHLLGYFVRTDHAGLNAALQRLCERRRQRFAEYVAALAAAGLVLPAEAVAPVVARSPSLGRRHLARLLVAARFARHHAEAWHRFLGPLSARVVPKLLLPVEEAIALVTAAGGVSALAHPPADLTDDDWRSLAGAGLHALEADYPARRSGTAARRRELAARLGLAVTGGSDCHGPEPLCRRIGSRGITCDEVNAVRERAAQPGSSASRN